MLLAGAVVVLAAPAWAQTAQGWPQFQGGPAHTGAVPAGPQPAYRVAWTAPRSLGGPRDAYGLSSPVIIGELAIAVGPEEVVAVDVATGEVAWTVRRALGPSVPPAVGPSGGDELVVYTEGWGSGPPDQSPSATPSGTSSSPSVSPSPSPGAEAAATSRLVAVSLQTQERAWRVDLPDVSRTGVSLDATTAYVGTNDGAVTAVDLATGDVRWTGQAGGYLESPLAVGDGLVLASVRGTSSSAMKLVALRVEDGSQAWTYAPATASVVGGAPTIFEGTAYVALADSTVRAVALDSGVQRWLARLNSYVIGASPVVVDGGVIVADNRGQVYRLDAATGARVWDFALNVTVLRTAPVAIGEVLALATTDGELTVFDLATGDLVWRSQVADAPVRGLAVGADTLVAVRAGTGAGLFGLTNDPAGALVRVQSPTILEPVVLFGGWALAAVPLVLGLFLLGRNMWARLGVPQFSTGEDDLAGEDDE